jgi:nucleoside phosphorylase
METGGIKDVMRFHNNRYIAIKGICDYCDGNKNDDWHNYASAVAAAYTYALIRSIPSNIPEEIEKKHGNYSTK